jgi:HAE1 family hydrophobic/amphiphilic exporter-1
LPLAFGIGAGAETRAPLARSIIGGVALSTLVTLIIVPVFYVLFDRFGSWVRHMTERAEPPHRAPAPSVNGAAPSHPAAHAARNGEAYTPRSKELEPVLELRPEGNC